MIITEVEDILMNHSQFEIFLTKLKTLDPELTCCKLNHENISST